MIADRVANQKSADTALLARTDEVIERNDASLLRCLAARSGGPSRRAERISAWIGEIRTASWNVYRCAKAGRPIPA
jgi:hypothetical protein